MKKLTIVIPNREGESPDVTIRSLYRQDFKDFDIIIINDREGNANTARNAGFEFVKTPYVLFSDNDIVWNEPAINLMIQTLEANPEISYAYGSYYFENHSAPIQCTEEFNADLLRKRNFISTMSVIRSVHFPGFDPEIRRFQDWDLWLTMLEQGHTGKNIGTVAFTTNVRRGITYSGLFSTTDALRAIQEKHNLQLV